jgi:hypothetical protein
MKLRLLLVILAACVALGLWRFSPAPATKDAAIEPAKAETSSSPRGVAELVGPGGDDEMAVRAVEAHGASRKQVETAAPAAAAVAELNNEPEDHPPVADGPQLEIRVVHKDGGAPVAGIAVFALEFEERVPPPKEWLEVLQTEGLGPMVERFGITRQTDANGNCQVPLPQGSLFARARGLGLVGASAGDQELSNPLILEVEPVSGHRVIAHGASGEPMAGVRVGIAPIENTQLSEEPLFLMAVAETEGSPPSALLSPPLEMKSRFGRMQAAVIAVGLFAAPVSAELKDPMGAEEVHLQLPACGSVILKLSDQVVQENSSRAYELTSVGGTSYRLPLALENGVGRSDWVQFGQRIEVSSVELGADGFVRQPLGSFDGPTQANPVVEFVLEPPPVAFVSGIALNADGAPLARHQVEFSVKRSGSDRSAVNSVLSASGYAVSGEAIPEIDPEAILPDVLGQVQTDAQGHFRVRAEWLPGLKKAGSLGYVTGVHLAARRHGTLVGDLDLPTEAFAKDALLVELGQLTFQGVPLLISGRVLDKAGRAVSGFLSYTPCDGPADPELPMAGQHDPLRVGRQGQFEIHQHSTKSQVRLEFQGDWHVTREPVFAPIGVTGFDLVVGGAGGLVYEVVPPAALPTEFFIFNLRTELVAAGATAPDEVLQRAQNTSTLEGEGRYSVRSIPEGNYRLNVWLGDLALAEHDRPDVVIRSGELTDLGRIDFSSGLTFLELRFDPPVPEGEFPWIALDDDQPLEATLINWYQERFQWVLVGRNLPARLRLRGEKGVVEGVVEGQTLLVPRPQ